MKIDEACINHNVSDIIESMLLWEYADMADSQKSFALGYIQGVNEMAQRMKEVLRT